MEIKKATRQGIKPLIGLFGKSGGGKTLTALYLARGLVGPSGKIILIDTENGRGQLFADIVPGGYGTIDLQAPFTPERYVEAIDLAEKSADVVIIDSMTHEWDGEKGILELAEEELSRMAGDSWEKRKACTMASWIKPKQRHKKLVYRILRSALPMICCLRGAERTEMTKDKKGKTVVETSENSFPIYDKRFIFEMLINGEVLSKENSKGENEGGYVRFEKITHPDIKTCLPKTTEQFEISHGECLAKWCASPGGAEPAPKPEDVPESANNENQTLEERLSGCDDIEQVKKVWGEANDALNAGVITKGAYEILTKIKNTKKKQFDNQNKGDN